MNRHCSPSDPPDPTSTKRSSLCHGACQTARPALITARAQPAAQACRHELRVLRCRTQATPRGPARTLLLLQRQQAHKQRRRVHSAGHVCLVQVVPRLHLAPLLRLEVHLQGRAWVEVVRADCTAARSTRRQGMALQAAGHGAAGSWRQPTSRRAALSASAGPMWPPTSAAARASDLQVLVSCSTAVRCQWSRPVAGRGRVGRGGVG